MCKPFKRKKRKVHQFIKRAGCTDGHHLISSSKGGESLDSNMLRIDAYRHDAWHILFGHQTINEIVELLKNYKSGKEFLRTINNYYKHQAYRLLLGKKTIEEVIVLMLRIKSIKKAQAQRLFIMFKSAKLSKLSKAA
jgi:4-hydroxyphenylpyruvate dioxygenase-like putative hemolysin